MDIPLSFLMITYTDGDGNSLRGPINFINFINLINFQTYLIVS